MSFDFGAFVEKANRADDQPDTEKDTSMELSLEDRTRFGQTGNDFGATTIETPIDKDAEIAALRAELEKSQSQVELLAGVAGEPEVNSELKSRFKDLSCLDDFTSTAWLVEEVILDKGLGQVVAQPGVGKTLWAIDLALHIASGKEKWMGCEINNEGKPLPVAYVAMEGGDVFMSYLQGWFLGHPEVKREDVMPYFKWIDGADGYEVLIDDEALKDSVPFQDSLSRLGQVEIDSMDEKPVLIVFDTQIDILGMLNENDNAQVGRAFKKIKAFAEKYEAYALMVHHMRKDGGYRGAGAQLGKTDMQVELDTTDDYLVTATFNKIKGGERPYKDHSYVIEKAKTPRFGKDGKVKTNFEGQPEMKSVPYIVNSEDAGALSGAQLQARAFAQVPVTRIQQIQKIIIDSGPNGASATAIKKGLGKDRSNKTVEAELESLVHYGWIQDQNRDKETSKTAYVIAKHA